MNNISLLERWTDPWASWKQQYLQRLKHAFLNRPSCFSLKGLHAYWKAVRHPQSERGFKEAVLREIEVALNNLPCGANAVDVQQRLASLTWRPTRAGPAWMEACAHNELIHLSQVELHALAQQLDENAKAQRAQIASVLKSEAVVHQETGARAVVLSTAYYSLKGLECEVLTEGEIWPQHWPAKALQAPLCAT